MLQLRRFFLAEEGFIVGVDDESNDQDEQADRQRRYGCYRLDDVQGQVKYAFHDELHLTRMEWSNLYLKVSIKNGVVVITLDEDDLEFVYWHEREFNECFYNKQEKT